MQPRAVDVDSQGNRRWARYLKLIALFKICKGMLLLLFGISVLFLNSRPLWMDAVSDWVDDEALVVHGRAAHFVLSWVQQVLNDGGGLHLAALLAMLYSGVLFTEGIGVYLQKRWGEYLMIFATAALIPLEVRHLWHLPSAGAAVVLVVNCLIVWFLARVLRREKPAARNTPLPEVVETSVR